MSKPERGSGRLDAICRSGSPLTFGNFMTRFMTSVRFHRILLCFQRSKADSVSASREGQAPVGIEVVDLASLSMTIEFASLTPRARER